MKPKNVTCAKMHRCDNDIAGNIPVNQSIWQGHGESNPGSQAENLMS